MFKFRCLQKLGERHPYLTLPLVPELLSLHPFLDMTEQNVEDPACILFIYVCVFVLGNGSDYVQIMIFFIRKQIW